MKKERTGWALKWRSKNRLAGKTEYLFGDFKTRAEARQHRDKEFGYIRHRPDLRCEPHGWKLPAVVRVRIIVTEEINAAHAPGRAA